MNEEGKSILIVSRNSNRSELLQVIARDMGYSTLVAADGQHGLITARRNRIDLIIVEDSLSDTDILAMTWEVRTDPDLHRIPIVLLDAEDLDSQAVVSDRDGARSQDRRGTSESLGLIMEVVEFPQRKFAVRDVTGTAQREGSTAAADERDPSAERLLQAQKMEAIGQLAGGIAHDFNNMLTAINGYSELALERLHADDPVRRDIHEIRKAGERAASLTRQLLAFSRKQVLHPRLLDLNNIVSELGKMLQRLIGEDITLRTVLRPGQGNIHADPGQVEQIIMNLAVNARDAMPDGGALTIETQAVELDENYIGRHEGAKAGAYVMLAVSDTGAGMDDRTRKRIFEPFFTTKGLGKGTGLGLSTVYGIVKQSGGHIWVYSEPGKGTMFKIYLPRVEEGAGEYRRRTEEGELLRGSETIVVAEDEEMLRELVRAVLEKQGYQVMTAPDGSAALTLCTSHIGPIHLLISDIIMPELGGGELASRLVKLRPEMKVIYMSGYTDETIAHHGIVDPGVAFLQKPFTPHDLLRKVREVLEA